MTRHEALLAASPGYAEFVAEIEEDEPPCSGQPWFLDAFAVWLLAPLPYERNGYSYSTWTADQFREEWGRWNS